MQVSGFRPVVDEWPKRFVTGKERDPESAPPSQPLDGLDNFGARYNSSLDGRFMSPDPAGLVAAVLTNPQSWNAYGYVGNNPLRFTDPLGLSACGYGNNGGGENDDVLCEELNDDSWWQPLRSPGEQLANVNSGQNFNGGSLHSPFDFEFSGNYCNGGGCQYYVGVFNSWDAYASWGTGIAALPQNQPGYLNWFSEGLGNMLGALAQRPDVTGAQISQFLIANSDPYAVPLVGGHFDFSNTDPNTRLPIFDFGCAHNRCKKWT
jgi:RHS repeat-associated protein